MLTAYKKFELEYERMKPALMRGVLKTIIKNKIRPLKKMGKLKAENLGVTSIMISRLIISWQLSTSFPVEYRCINNMFHFVNFTKKMFSFSNTCERN